MKKGFLITVIAVAVIGIAVGIGVGVAKEGSHSVNNVVKSSANNGTSNNFNNNNNSSNNGGSTSSGNESSSNGSTSSDSGSSSSSSSSNSTSSSSETKLNVGLKNQATLSALAPQYLNEFANIIAQSAAIGIKGYTDSQMAEENNQIYNLWNNELNKLYGDIEKNLTPKEAEFLKNQENEWVNYKNNAIKKIGDQPWCSMIPLLQGTRATQMNQERCYYLFFYYLDNDNTNLDLSGLVNGNEKVSEHISEFNFIENKAKELISNSKSNDELVKAYNNINNQWVNEIDGVYQHAITCCNNSEYEISNIRTPEEEWVNFKSNELNLAQNYYSSSDMGSIASDKVSIALIKAKIFTLFNYIINLSQN